MKCYKCGKDMTKWQMRGEIESLIGIKISAHANLSREERNFVQRQLGKYEIGKDYNFCLECYIDSLMK